jgi:hypothetical protein
MTKQLFNPEEVKFVNKYTKLMRMYVHGEITRSVFLSQCDKMKEALEKAGIDVVKFIAKTKNIIVE